MSHRAETEGQVERLEEVFLSLGEKVLGKHCDGIAGIIEEGKSVMEDEFDDATMDACLIASGQRAEHYEMAAYGTLVSWATAMGHSRAVELLQQNLDEEKAADEKLSQLADGRVNREAASGIGSSAEGDSGVVATVTRAVVGGAKKVAEAAGAAQPRAKARAAGRG